MPQKIPPQSIGRVKEGLVRLRAKPGVKASVDLVGISTSVEPGALDEAISKRDSVKIDSILEKGMNWDEAYFLEFPPVTDFPQYSSIQSLKVELSSSSTEDMALLHRLLSYTKDQKNPTVVANQ